MRPISMSYLTAPMADPIESLTVAAQAGYDGLGLRLHDPVDGTLSPCDCAAHTILVAIVDVRAEDKDAAHVAGSFEVA